MSELNDLATLLDGASANPPQTETVQPEQPAASEPTEPSTQPGDKQEAAPPAALEESDDGPPVPRKALVDERRKRQELERQLEEITKKYASQPVQTQPQAQPQPQQQPVEPLPERPDPWIDPQGAMDWDRAWMQQQVHAQVFETRTVLSREMMMASKPDFAEVEAVFMEAAKRSPALVQRLMNHPMPAKFAYEQGLKIRAMSEIGDDPVAYKQRVREELEAELRGQSSTPPAQPQTPKGSTPKSLAATPSNQPRDDRGRFQGPASLESILGG